MLRCKHGILQYVVIRPITTLIAFISQIFGFYGEQNYNPLSGYTHPVLLIINNLSQFTAMYSLVIFYKGYKQELHPMQPLTKFFSIKLVVFFSFFQSVLIAGLMEIEIVEQTVRGWYPELNDKILVGRKLQEFLICIDMLIAALGHLYAFSYKPFTEDDETLISLNNNESIGNWSDYENHSCCRALRNIFDFNDEKSDVTDYLAQIVNRVRQLFTFGPSLPSVVSTNSPTTLRPTALGLPAVSKANSKHVQQKDFDGGSLDRISQMSGGGSPIIVIGSGATNFAVHNNNKNKNKNYQSIR